MSPCWRRLNRYVNFFCPYVLMVVVIVRYDPPFGSAVALSAVLVVVMNTLNACDDRS